MGSHVLLGPLRSGLPLLSRRGRHMTSVLPSELLPSTSSWSLQNPQFSPAASWSPQVRHSSSPFPQFPAADEIFPPFPAADDSFPPFPAADDRFPPISEPHPPRTDNRVVTSLAVKAESKTCEKKYTIYYYWYVNWYTMYLFYFLVKSSDQISISKFISIWKYLNRGCKS